MAPSRSRKGGDAHRKNNHPKRAFRQVRLDVEGLDIVNTETKTNENESHVEVDERIEAVEDNESDQRNAGCERHRPAQSIAIDQPAVDGRQNTALECRDALHQRRRGRAPAVFVENKF